MGFEGKAPAVEGLINILANLFRAQALPMQTGSFAKNPALAAIFIVAGGLMLAIHNIAVQVIHRRRLIKLRKKRDIITAGAFLALPLHAGSERSAFLNLGSSATASRRVFIVWCV